MEIQDKLYNQLMVQIPSLVARYIAYELENRGATDILSVKPNSNLSGMNPRTTVFTIETNNSKTNWESLDPLPIANEIS